MLLASVSGMRGMRGVVGYETEGVLVVGVEVGEEVGVFHVEPDGDVAQDVHFDGLQCV